MEQKGWEVEDRERTVQDSDSLSATHFQPSTFFLASFIFGLIYRWAPAVLWMAGIFYFSSRSQPLGPISRSNHSGVIGRVAHIVEYIGLLLLLHRALSNNDGGHVTSASPNSSANEDHDISAVSSRRSIVSSRPLLMALATTFTCAILDELYQQLTPDRSFELTDIGYDLAGMTAALGLVWIRSRFENSELPQ